MKRIAELFTERAAGQAALITKNKSNRAAPAGGEAKHCTSTSSTPERRRAWTVRRRRREPITRTGGRQGLCRSDAWVAMSGCSFVEWDATA